MQIVRPGCTLRRLDDPCNEQQSFLTFPAFLLEAACAPAKPRQESKQGEYRTSHCGNDQCHDSESEVRCLSHQGKDIARLLVALTATDLGFTHRVLKAKCYATSTIASNYGHPVCGGIDRCCAKRGEVRRQLLRCAAYDGLRHGQSHRTCSLLILGARHSLQCLVHGIRYDVGHCRAQILGDGL